MGKLNLRQKLEKLAEINLVITGITTSKTRDGEFVAVLQLDEPLDYVRGSQEVEFNGKRQALEAYDVTEVKIHEGDIDVAEDDFQFDEEGTTGVYSGTKLILDVAKTGQVWLRSESFAAAGSEMRRANQTNRVSKIVEQAVARQQAAKEKKGGISAGTQLVDTE